MAEGTLVITISNQVASPPIVSPPLFTGTFITGWHVPLDTEWAALSTYLASNGYGYGGSGTDIAKSVASKKDWIASIVAGTVGNDQLSNNATGLNGIPRGWRYSTGYFTIDRNETSQWWSATTRTASTAWYKFIFYAYAFFYRDFYDKKSGFSIRLMADSTMLNDGDTGTVTDYDGNVYPTICIDGNEYMAANLATTHYDDGTPIPIVTDQITWATLKTAGMCYYNNTP